MDLTALVEERDKAATDHVMQLVNNLPSIGLPTQNPMRTPDGTHRLEVKFDPSTTSAIVAASKARGFTVTTAVHAALIVALQQVVPVPPSPSSTYSTWGIFNIRPLLQAPFNDSVIHPAGVHIIGLPLTLNTSTYADLADQLKQYYKQRLPPSPESHIQEGIIVPCTNRMADLAGQSPPPELPAPSEPMLSSTGIVDGYLKRYYGDVIEVKDFWVGVEMMTAQVVCLLWTWQGKMTLSTLYNEAFYEKDFIQGFMKQITDVLCTDLEIGKA